ncbi:circadian input kinase A [Pseudanabaena sp. lw0831]|uniref:ATP-binding response regulator n=1 Tax=Pseudanabaena sp. lw0831 TaxID=1357935 RepID=UPI00191638B4|nr:response regulator [Pseudanabaena sp. lw0831]GBO52120.1 circadian input kinase A [Pseudanabaena sp. lw0831]
MSVQVVIVEDERLVAQDIAQILRDEGYFICAIASDGQTAIEKILEFSPDLVLLDIRIKGEIDGIDVAKFIQSFCDIPIVYLSAFSDSETLKRAQLTNPMGYVVKPFRSEQLLTTIKIALTTHSSKQEKNQESLIKSKFLSIIRDELRNPLNAILGFSECLKGEMLGSVNVEQVEALQVINSSGNHLLRLINNIIDLSMLEAGQFNIQFGLMSISSTCQVIVEHIQKDAVKKQINLEAKIQDDLPLMLLDERRIFKVLVDLLGNAIKFTQEHGHVTLEVTHEHQIEQKSFIRIAITDTGIGISPENLHQLFQPFSQADTSLSRKYGGMGLGLASSKRIIELHGGRIEVASELGVGSCFTVYLPCGQA